MNDNIGTYAIGIIEPDPSVRDELVAQVSHLGPTSVYPSLLAFVDVVAVGTSFVLVMGPSLGSDAELAAFEDVSLRRPEVRAVALVADATRDIMRAAMRAGIDDVVSVHDDLDVLVTAVAEAGGKIAMQVAQLPSQTAVPAAPTVDAARLGKVICVYSAKGGAGKSVIAANLGVVMARRCAEPVILVDADLQFGDMAVMLKLQPRHTVVDAVAAMSRLDTGLMRSLLVKHEQSGLMVLPAPLEPAFADQITSNDMVQIIQILRQIGAYIIIDTPSHLTEVVIAIIEASDEILLVAGMDIPNIKNVKVVLQSLRQLQFPMERIHLALNRANSKVKLDIGEVEKTLQLKAEILIPSDIVIPRSVNKGVPAVVDAPKSEVAMAFEQTATLFMGLGAANPDQGRKGRFR